VIVSGQRPSPSAVSAMLKSTDFNFTNIKGSDYFFEDEAEYHVSNEVRGHP
jgi:hypothetical protein